MSESTGAKRQLALARDEGRLPGLVEALADRFLIDPQPAVKGDEPSAAVA